MCPLQPYPPEIWLLILTHIPNQRERKATAKALALTCRATLEIGQGIYWDNKWIRLNAKTCHDRLERALRFPTRAARIRLLSIDSCISTSTRITPDVNRATFLESMRVDMQRRIGLLPRKRLPKRRQDTIVQGAVAGLAVAEIAMIMLYTQNVRQLHVIGYSLSGKEYGSPPAWAIMAGTLKELRTVRVSHYDLAHILPAVMGGGVWGLNLSRFGTHQPSITPNLTRLGLLASTIPALRCLELRHLMSRKFSYDVFAEVIQRCTHLQYLALWFGFAIIGDEAVDCRRIMTAVQNSPACSSLLHLSVFGGEYYGEECTRQISALTAVEELDLPARAFSAGAFSNATLPDGMLSCIQAPVRSLCISCIDAADLSPIRRVLEYPNSTQSLFLDNARSVPTTIFLEFSGYHDAIRRPDASPLEWDFPEETTLDQYERHASYENAWHQAPTPKIPSLAARARARSSTCSTALLLLNSRYWRTDVYLAFADDIALCRVDHSGEFKFQDSVI